MPPKDELKAVNPIPVDDAVESSNDKEAAETVAATETSESTSKPDDKSDDKTGDKSNDKSSDKSQDKSGDKSADKPEVTKDDEHEPTPPPRPESPFTQALATLAEAFPDVDASVRRAVLVASRGQLDPAFAALLSMSDPNFKPEEVVPPITSDPTEPDEKEVAMLRRKKKQEQIEADERLARRLASQYSSSGPRQGQGRSSTSSRRSAGSGGGTGRYDDPSTGGGEEERNFFDDELPEIKKQLQEGFIETKQKVSEWYTNFKKQQQSGGGLLSQFTANRAQQQDAYRGGGRGDYDDGEDYSGGRARRNPDSYRPRYRNPNQRYYDRDPDELSGDLQGITLRAEDEEDDLPPPPPPRRPTTTAAVTTDTSSVAPVSALGDSTSTKWEPLKAVSAEGDDKDAFFIGDSDDDDLEFDDDEEDTGAGKSGKSEPKSDAKAGSKAELKGAKEEVKEAKDEGKTDTDTAKK